MNEEIIVNAENAVLGRIASFAAKKALEGNKVVIVNAEKAVITGNKKNILERYLKKRTIGGSGLKGPNFPSLPEKILKRTIRGMLRYKKGRGREAYKRVLCFAEIPKEYENKKMISIKRNKTGISLEEVSILLRGGKWKKE